MSNLSYLFGAFAIVWAGIFLYMWTLRRSAQRLTEEIRSLTAERGLEA